MNEAKDPALRPEQIAVLAAELRRAYDTKEPIANLRDRMGSDGLDEAYAVQESNTAYWINNGRRLVGCKIGLTSPAVQKQLGVDQPDFGMLFADMAVGEGEPIAVGRVLQPKIEVEVALILGRNLDVVNPTISDIVAATEYVVPALEIVGSRISKWDIKIVDTIADNASSGLFVLGGPFRRLSGLELRNFNMTLRRNGEVVSSGTGAACLGHPLNAAVWLAGEVARRGRPLKAGDVVLTGALGPMVEVNPGDVFDAELEGFGTVNAVFAIKTLQ
ncbi:MULTISPECIES: 2-keto-4-pentenoate hydratase [unclassified Pseudomonas]|uniref:2-keto-4-pentenoate hydratase n=1 Tax=unclassified Pseudomonas TaxID=196821 RepID=UPI0008717055|nr:MULTISPECIES: 2-keto-4-pentenoate hydratase [unclassified Pseudomonas]SCW56820.1 2-keto-4-pentenoate hydratase [Pseudomonas sp. NFACC56-3]SFK30687.1 2-keto-4-pentenoate hydratase [Pseudomonas sp. NFACC52]